MSDIKAIIFDVDGVVFKTHDEKDGSYLWSKNAKRDLGLSSMHFKHIFSDDWDDIVRGKISFKTHLEKVFAEKAFREISVKPDEFLDYWLSNDNNIQDDILSLVKQIKIPCYLGTNQESIRTNHIKKYVGNYFQDCFASYQIGFAKPEKQFFSYIEKALSLNPSQLLLIDDTKVNILAAKKYGWSAYNYKGCFDSLRCFLLPSVITK